MLTFIRTKSRGHRRSWPTGLGFSYIPGLGFRLPTDADVHEPPIAGPVGQSLVKCHLIHQRLSTCGTLN